MIQINPESGELRGDLLRPTTACAFGGSNLDRLFIMIIRMVEENAGKVWVDDWGSGVEAFPYGCTRSIPGRLIACVAID